MLCLMIGLQPCRQVRTTDRPDFTSDTWHKLFGDSRFQYVFDEDDLDEPTQADPFHPVDPLVHERRAAVEAAMDTSQPAVPLPVPPPPVIVGSSPQAPPPTPVLIRAPPVTVDDVVAPQASPVQREQPLQRESPAQVDPPTQRESVTQPSQPLSEPHQASPSCRQREKNVSNEQVSSNENAPLRRSTRHRKPVDCLSLLAERKNSLLPPSFKHQPLILLMHSPSLCLHCTMRLSCRPFSRPTPSRLLSRTRISSAMTKPWETPTMLTSGKKWP